ncbi:FHA domain protein [Stieleria maiorica]|uniref:FHA domain protein n=1 Tax=Stieleria maiorica TaxID=2795974 RepID=A0A5B9MHB1_9BACT|nr:FHA domain-containing protein [Stieleria maiorica]QEF98467.1 FHA domain protein [Stieleria maiorica]
MKIVLEIVEGAGFARKRSLRAPAVLVVGRGEASDWMHPDDPTMSARHFEVSVQFDGCTVTDLNSTNGTLVDGQKISRQPITDGIKIKAGSTVFRVFILQPASGTSRTTDFPAPQNDLPAEPPPRHKSPVVASNPSKPHLSNSVGQVLRQTDVISPTNPTRVDAADERAAYDGSGPSAHRPKTGAVIEVVSEFGRGRKSILRPGQSVTVGRTENSDFAIADPKLSATHFSLADGRSGWQLTDLGSGTGTAVNGVKKSTTVVRTGDRIVAGQTEFLVTIGESAPSSGQRGGFGQSFQEGVRDNDPHVRRAAIHAAAWCREAWLLDFCRECACDPSPDQWDALEMLSILGLPIDLDLIRSLIGHSDLGPGRFEWLASYGHPAVLPDLFDAMRSDDLAVVVVAGSAFSRITGWEFGSEDVATLQDDDFMLPDVQRAQQEWDRHCGQFASGTRYHQGIETSGAPTPELLQQLDMRSRWEACLRGKYEGTWNGSPFDLQRYSLHELLQVQG